MVKTNKKKADALKSTQPIYDTKKWVRELNISNLSVVNKTYKSNLIIR